MSAAPPLLFLSPGRRGGLKPNKTIQEIRIVKLAAIEAKWLVEMKSRLSCLDLRVEDL